MSRSCDTKVTLKAHPKEEEKEEEEVSAFQHMAPQYIHPG